MQGNRIRRTALIMCALGMLAAASPARADIIFSGTCTITVTMDFVGTVTTSSAAKVVSSFDLTGSCLTSMVPNNIQKNFDYSGDGDADPATCHSILAIGFGFGDFSPAPAPPDVPGQWTYVGTIAGGLVILESDVPRFVGVALVANTGTAMTTCANGGVSIVTWTGVMVFNDP